MHESKKSLIGFYLLISALAAALILVMTSTSMYYNSKLSFILYQAVRRTAARCSWNDSVSLSSELAEQHVKQVLAQMLAESGLPQFHECRLSMRDGDLELTAGIEGFPDWSKNEYVPAYISFQQTTIVSTSDWQPPALMMLKLPQATLCLPAYGRNLAGYSNGNLPAAAAPSGTAVFRNFRRQYGQIGMGLVKVIDYAEERRYVN